MFGAVDETRPHTIVTVNKTVQIDPLRRAVLSPGSYKLQGDVRGKLRHINVKRLMAAGFFTVAYVEGAPEVHTVSAQTQFESVVADLNNAPDAVSAAETDLPMWQRQVDDANELARQSEEEAQLADEEAAQEASAPVKQRRKRRTKKELEDARVQDVGAVVEPTPLLPDAVEASPDAQDEEEAAEPAAPSALSYQFTTEEAADNVATARDRTRPS